MDEFLSLLGHLVVVVASVTFVMFLLRRLTREKEPLTQPFSGPIALKNDIVAEQELPRLKLPERTSPPLNRNEVIPGQESIGDWRQYGRKHKLSLALVWVESLVVNGIVPNRHKQLVAAAIVEQLDYLVLRDSGSDDVNFADNTSLHQLGALVASWIGESYYDGPPVPVFDDEDIQRHALKAYATVNDWMNADENTRYATVLIWIDMYAMRGLRIDRSRHYVYLIANAVDQKAKAATVLGAHDQPLVMTLRFAMESLLQ